MQSNEQHKIYKQLHECINAVLKNLCPRICSSYQVSWHIFPCHVIIYECLMLCAHWVVVWGFVQTVFGYFVFCICCFVVCCLAFNVLRFVVWCFLVLHMYPILNKSTYSYGCPKSSLLSSIMCMWLPLNTTTQEKKKIKRFKTSILLTRP